MIQFVLFYSQGGQHLGHCPICRYFTVVQIDKLSTSVISSCPHFVDMFIGNLGKVVGAFKEE